MSKYDMCEAMYALSHGAIVPRRRSMVAPAIIVAAGVALIAINGLLVEGVADRSSLKAAIMLFGVAIVVVGVIFALVRRSGEPFLVADGCFLCKKELKFYKERSSEVRDLVKRGDFTTLRELPEDGVSAVTVVLYTSPRSSFTVAQVFEYQEMEIRPTREIVMKA